MNIYHYDQDGVYERLSVADSVPLLATEIECLYAQKPNDVAVFSEENQAWTLVEDYRGMNIYSDTQCDIVETLGAIPEGFFLEKPPAYIAIENYLEFKASRAGMVAAILVTVNTKTYQGDETSQDRMVRTIVAAEAGGLTTIPFWVLADNTVNTDIPLTEFKEVLIASLSAMAALWVYTP